MSWLVTKVAILEVGCGIRVRTMRHMSQAFLDELPSDRSTLIRYESIANNSYIVTEIAC
jgi:hypothetical protein